MSSIQVHICVKRPKPNYCAGFERKDIYVHEIVSGKLSVEVERKKQIRCFR